jgi:hypothetical protein
VACAARSRAPCGAGLFRAACLRIRYVEFHINGSEGAPARGRAGATRLRAHWPLIAGLGVYPYAGWFRGHVRWQHARRRHPRLHVADSRRISFQAKSKSSGTWHARYPHDAAESSSVPAETSFGSSWTREVSERATRAGRGADLRRVRRSPPLPDPGCSTGGCTDWRRRPASLCTSSTWCRVCWEL